MDLESGDTISIEAMPDRRVRLRLERRSHRLMLTTPLTVKEARALADALLAAVARMASLTNSVICLDCHQPATADLCPTCYYKRLRAAAMSEAEAHT